MPGKNHTSKQPKFFFFHGEVLVRFFNDDANDDESVDALLTSC